MNLVAGVLAGFLTTWGLLMRLRLGNDPANLVTSIWSATPPGWATVSTECGDVTGVPGNVVTAFKGIQYATAERWKPPQNLKAAQGCWAPKVEKAMSNGPACINILGKGKSAKECLTLNVWTPNAALQGATAGPRPCMVFFHGGDLTLGSAGTNFDRVSGHGDGMVVVDVNYRLNLAGFLSVDAMLVESATNTTGMFGVRDMIESLRWTQRNIPAFGGDTSRVTIFGQSSGGTGCLLLVASPLARGLFTSAMSLSGSPNVTMDALTQRRQHQHMVDSVGCAGEPDAVMSCLRNKGLGLRGALWLAEPKGGDHGPKTQEEPSWAMDNIMDLPRYADGLRAPGIAVVDGDVLRAPLDEALATAAGSDVPFIVSSMGQEVSNGAQVKNFSPAELENKLNSIFVFVNSTFGSQIAGVYADDIAVSRELAWDNIGTDLEMTCGNRQLAQKAASGFKQPVYWLHNEQHKDGGWSDHGSDLEMATSGTDARADSLRDVWHEFAASGRVQAWTPVKRGTTTAMRLTNSGAMVFPGFKSVVCDFWSSAGFGPEFYWSN